MSLDVDPSSDDWLDAEVDEHEARRRLGAIGGAWHIIVALFVLGGALGWFVGDSVATNHSASATINITSAAAGTREDTVTDDQIEARRRILVAEEATDVVVAGLADPATGAAGQLSSIGAISQPRTHLIDVTVTATTADSAVAALELLLTFTSERAIALETEAIDRQLAVAASERRQLISELDDRTTDWLAALRAEAPGSIAGAEHEMFGISNRIFFVEGEIFTLRIERALSTGNIAIVDRATEASANGSARTLALAGGALAFALLGAAVAVALAARDDRIRSLADLDDCAVDVAMLSTLPIDANAVQLTETGRRLRHTLAALRRTYGGWGSVAVVGVESSIDSATVTQAMARSYCAAGADTLLIEGDTAGSRLEFAFGDARLTSAVPKAVLAVRNTEDSTTRLAAAADLPNGLPLLLTHLPCDRQVNRDNALHFFGTDSAESIERVETGPADLFGVLEATKLGHDIVVAHGGPVLELADALSWAVAADITVITVRLGSTTRRDLRRTIARLGNQGARIAGLVVTHDSNDVGHRNPIDLRVSQIRDPQ